MDDATIKKLENDCIKLIISKRENKLTPDEFYIKLMELHKKYPMEGHNPPLTVFQQTRYLELETPSEERVNVLIKEEKKKEDNVYKSYPWSDCIQPLNFQEAAEMYIRNYNYRKDLKPLPKLKPLKKEDRKERPRYPDD